MSLAPTYPAHPSQRGADSGREIAFAFLAGLLAVTAWTPEFGSLPGGMSLFYIVCVIVLLLVAVRAPRLQPPIGPVQHSIVRVIFACALFIGGWALLTVFQSEEPLRVGRPVAAYCIGPVLFFLLNRLIPPHRIDNVIAWQLYCAAGAAFLSLLALYIPFLAAAIFEDSDRAHGLFKHPNQFAIALSTIAPVLTAMVLGSKERMKWGAILAIVIIGFVLAGSKANTVVVVASMFLLALFGAVTHRSALRSILFLLAFALLTVAMLFVTWELILALNPRMAMLLTTIASGEEIHSVSERYVLWDMSIQQFLANPLFGQGGGATVLYGTDESVSHSHNLVLDAARTLGVPGFAAVVVFTLALLALIIYQSIVAVTMRSVDRLERMKLVGLTLGLLSYYIANLSSDSFGPSTSPIFWFVLTLSLWQCQKVQAFAREAAFARVPPRHFQR